MRHDTSLLADLEAAADGLLYPSETDAPLTAFEWTGGDAPTAAAIAAARGLPADAPLETTTLADELGPLAGDDGGDDAPRWAALVALVERSLTDVAVHRVGAPDVLVVVVGRSPSGAWLGLETRAVET
jgi:hypothetical protein